MVRWFFSCTMVRYIYSIWKGIFGTIPCGVVGLIDIKVVVVYSNDNIVNKYNVRS